MSHRALSPEQFFDTPGIRDVPTEHLKPLTHHDAVHSVKTPGLYRDVKEQGIKEPVEVEVHQGGRLKLAEGSHRVNIAHRLKMPTVPARVIHLEGPDLDLQGRPKQ